MSRSRLACIRVEAVVTAKQDLCGGIGYDDNGVLKVGLVARSM